MGYKTLDIGCLTDLELKLRYDENVEKLDRLWDNVLLVHHNGNVKALDRLSSKHKRIADENRRIHAMLTESPLT